VTTLSAPAGRTSSTVVTVPVAVSPTYGGIAVHNAAGSTHVVLHLVGWADDRAAGDDGRYEPLPVAARLADTRNGTDVPVGPLASGGTLTVPVAGHAGVPYGATAALLTVAAVRPAATGTLTVYPAGSPVPSAQQAGYAPARPGASLVVARLGPGGRVTVRASAGPVHVVVEVHGWYTGGGDYVPMPGGATAGGVVVDRASRYAYASNPALDRVEVVDLSSGTLLAPIPVGSKPAGLDLTPDGALLYVTNQGSLDVSVVDVATRTELRRIGTQYAPTDIAIGAHGIAVLYVLAPFYDEHVVYLRLADDRVYRSNGSWAPYTFGEGSLAASADREQIAIGSAGATPTDLAAYDATADAVTTPAPRLLDGTRRVAVSGDGTLLAALPYLVDRVTHQVRRLPGQEADPDYNSCTGAAFAPFDDVVYEACPGWVVAIATSDLGERGRVPYTGRVEWDYWVASGVAAGTPDGSRVLVVTTGGLALVPVGAPYR
jgi:YVTN family beta-propeller protein